MSQLQPHPSDVSHEVMEALRAIALLAAGLSTVPDRSEALALAFQLCRTTGKAHAELAAWDPPEHLGELVSMVRARLVHLHALARFQASDELEDEEYEIPFEVAGQQLEEAARTAYRWAVSANLYGAFEEGPN